MVRALVRGTQVVVPNGYSSPPMYLARPGFETRLVLIPPGALDTDAAVWPPEPIRLRALYGPFSYPAFNWSMVGLVVAAGVGWTQWVRPRHVARQREQATYHRIAAEVMESLHKTGGPAWVSNPSVVEGESRQRYLLMGVIGEGGMGTVYEALPVGGIDKVAIKLLDGTRVSASMLDRFRREVRICQTLQHPSIVKVLDFGQAGPVPFMAMELLTGVTLPAMMVAQPDLRFTEGHEQRVVGWLLSILKGLRIAHEAGIIHRDLKPENLMVTSSGHMKIMDFGIAHEVGASLTASREGLGTPSYMSPEHFQAKTVTPASDIYSLGIVAYELLSGTKPFPDQENTWALLVLIASEKPRPLLDANPSVSPGLAAIIMRMIDADLEIRYSTTAGLIDALSPFARETSAQAPLGD